MMTWIDIVSPQLRSTHQHWMSFRHARLLPHLDHYNGFVTAARGLVPDERSAVIAVPSDGGPAVFRRVGATLRATLLEGVADGRSVAEIPSVPARDTVRTHLRQVFAHRQPDCRRLMARRPEGAVDFEMLLLPFGDDQLRVCLIHALYEFRHPVAREHAA